MEVYICFLMLVIFAHTLVAKPIEEQNDLSSDKIEYSDIFNGKLSSSFLFICTIIIVVAGCTCCSLHQIKWFRKHRRRSNWNAIQNNQNEICIFPPPGVEDLYNSNVYIEPLPDLSSQLQSRIRAGRLTATSHLNELWFAEPHKNFPRNQLQYVKKLGSGWFGQVLEGRAIGLDTDQTTSIYENQSKTTHVVVKSLREDASIQEQTLFLHELIPFRDLSHTNVLKIVGYCLETHPWLVLFQHCDKGDLKNYLIKNAEEIQSDTLLKFCQNAADGLAHMHAYDFVHSDIAARNCLVESNLNVKIGDYGFSLQAYKEEYYFAGNMAVPIRWCSPESLKCTETAIETVQLTKSANVWSFGVLLWEIMTCGNLPYGDLDHDDVIQKVVLDWSRVLKLPEKLDNCNFKNNCAEILSSCFYTEPKRPSMKDLSAWLKSIPLQAHADFEHKWNAAAAVRGANQRFDEENASAHIYSEEPTELERRISEKFGGVYPSWMGLEPGEVMDSLTAEISDAIQKLDEALSEEFTTSSSTLSSPEKSGITQENGVSIRNNSFSQEESGIFRQEADDCKVKSCEDVENREGNLGERSQNSCGRGVSFRLGESRGKVRSFDGDTGALDAIFYGEEENLTIMRAQKGEFTELARVKSQSVQDLMKITVVDSSSDSSDKPSQPGSILCDFPSIHSCNNDKKLFNSEGNLTEVSRDGEFLVELEKLQAEHKFSITSETGFNAASRLDNTGIPEYNKYYTHSGYNSEVFAFSNTPFESFRSTENNEHVTEKGHFLLNNDPSLREGQEINKQLPKEGPLLSVSNLEAAGHESASPDCVTSSKVRFCSELPDLVTDNLSSTNIDTYFKNYDSRLKNHDKYTVENNIVDKNHDRNVKNNNIGDKNCHVSSEVVDDVSGVQLGEAVIFGASEQFTLDFGTHLKSNLKHDDGTDFSDSGSDTHFLDRKLEKSLSEINSENRFLGTKSEVNILESNSEVSFLETESEKNFLDADFEKKFVENKSEKSVFSENKDLMSDSGYSSNLTSSEGSKYEEKFVKWEVCSNIPKNLENFRIKFDDKGENVTEFEETLSLCELNNREDCIENENLIIERVIGEFEKNVAKTPEEKDEIERKWEWENASKETQRLLNEVKNDLLDLESFESVLDDESENENFEEKCESKNFNEKGENIDFTTETDVSKEDIDKLRFELCLKLPDFSGKKDAFLEKYILENNEDIFVNENHSPGASENYQTCSPAADNDNVFINYKTGRPGNLSPIKEEFLNSNLELSVPESLESSRISFLNSSVDLDCSLHGNLEQSDSQLSSDNKEKIALNSAPELGKNGVVSDFKRGNNAELKFGDTKFFHKNCQIKDNEFCFGSGNSFELYKNADFVHNVSDSNILENDSEHFRDINSQFNEDSEILRDSNLKYANDYSSHLQYACSEDMKNSIILENIENIDSSPSPPRLIGPITPRNEHDDFLLVDTETHESCILDFGKPKSHLAFIKQAEPEIYPTKIELPSEDTEIKASHLESFERDLSKNQSRTCREIDSNIPHVHDTISKLENDLIDDVEDESLPYDQPDSTSIAKLLQFNTNTTENDNHYYQNYFNPNFSSDFRNFNTNLVSSLPNMNSNYFSIGECGVNSYEDEIEHKSLPYHVNLPVHQVPISPESTSDVDSPKAIQQLGESETEKEWKKLLNISRNPTAFGSKNSDELNSKKLDEFYCKAQESCGVEEVPIEEERGLSDGSRDSTWNTPVRTPTRLSNYVWRPEDGASENIVNFEGGTTLKETGSSFRFNEEKENNLKEDVNCLNKNKNYSTNNEISFKKFEKSLKEEYNSLKGSESNLKENEKDRKSSNNIEIKKIESDSDLQSKFSPTFSQYIISSPIKVSEPDFENCSFSRSSDLELQSTQNPITSLRDPEIMSTKNPRVSLIDPEVNPAEYPDLSSANPDLALIVESPSLNRRDFVLDPKKLGKTSETTRSMDLIGPAQYIYKSAISDGPPSPIYAPDFESESDNDSENSLHTYSSPTPSSPVIIHGSPVSESESSIPRYRYPSPRSRSPIPRPVSPVPRPTSRRKSHSSSSSEDTSSESGEEDFTPSKWNKDLTPKRSMLKQSHLNSDDDSFSKKLVSWKRERHHRVYEYPPEPSNWHEDSHRRFRGLPSTHILGMTGLNRTNNADYMEYSNLFGGHSNAFFNNPFYDSMGNALAFERENEEHFNDNAEFYMGPSLTSFPFSQSSFTPADFFPRFSSPENGNTANSDQNFVEEEENVNEADNYRQNSEKARENLIKTEISRQNLKEMETSRQNVNDTKISREQLQLDLKGFASNES